MLPELKDFIQSNPDARELKRAVAVQMFLNGYKHREIQESLSVSSGFISKWIALYGEQGVQGLKLKYSLGYRPKNTGILKNFKPILSKHMRLSLTPNKATTPCSKKLGLAGKRLKNAIPRQTPN
jgi:hypothetical protein